MKTKISTIALVVIAVTVFMTTQGFSQTENEDQDNKTRGMMSMPPYQHFEELDLSEDQLKKIKEVRFELMKKQIKIESEIKINELELRKMMSDDASEKEINKQIDKISKHKGEKRKLHVRSHFEIKKSLSDEQWQSFKKRMHGKRMMKKMHDRGHMDRKYKKKKYVK